MTAKISTMFVPRSGWSWTNPIGTRANPTMTLSRHGSISSRCSFT